MKQFLCWLLALVLCILPVWAEETPGEADDSERYTEIRCPEDLNAIAGNPGGSFVLMEDLDLTGFPWECPDFSGKFDGNGHSLLNLSITVPGESRAEVLDGNQKPYDACFAGFFGKLTNATVRDLNLVNLRMLVETDEPCMAGGIAGYSMDSSILNCSVSGVLELRAHQGMIGLAGMVGYGVASVSGCRVDATLICVDTDSENLDEQFLGGVFGSGFVGVRDSEIHLDAYISEHGVVHSGGVGGMLLQYPIGMGREAYIRDNTISGKILFFEHSRIRRAYCKGTIGELLETMNYNYGLIGNNVDGFEKEEVKDFQRELRPETCEKPDYEETVVNASCDTYGYTQNQCRGCGYICRDHYTLHSHTVTQWKTVKPATETLMGLSKGKCDLCGAYQQREEPVLPKPPEPETVPETVPESISETLPVAESVEQAGGLPLGFWIVGGIVLVLIGCWLVFVLTEPKGKHLKKR